MRAAADAAFLPTPTAADPAEVGCAHANENPNALADALTDALTAATLLAIDPVGLGGVVLRAGHGPAREAWLAQLRRLLPAGTPQRRMPASADTTAVLGGLDFAASLQAGRPVLQAGLLVQADGGLLTLAMAERLSAASAALLAAALDTGEAVLERDGLACRLPARVGLVALDEGRDDDEQLPPALRERLAFRIEEAALAGLETLDLDGPDHDGAYLRAARQCLPRVMVGEDIAQALCAAAQALGVDSMRGPWLALRAARAAAAWEGRQRVTAEDAALAARLVLAHRATQLPAPAEPAPADPPQDSPEPPGDSAPDSPPAAASRQNPADPPPADAAPPPEAEDPATDATPPEVDLAERVINSAQAAIPPGLLALLAQGARHAGRAPGGAGRSGALRQGLHRGRPVGARRGEPRGGARLQLLETLRAAAPWQRLRAAQDAADPAARATRPSAAPAPTFGRVRVRREDFHVTHFKQRATTTTVFVVDASGSSALHRLAEAKGAVELLLADCYVRRDRVAVLGFRGQQAEVLLPPTRSLTRAKRSLAALPGGGGTPLASALDATRGLVEGLRRAGDTPVVVLLTDGRANIARDGAPGRQRATEDAIAAATALRALGASSLLLDTSPQPQAAAQALARCMGANYLPLPHADARAMSGAVRLATGRN